MIISLQQFRAQKAQKETVVLDFLINFFKEQAISRGVGVPYFIEARNHYKNMIHSYRDLNFYYNKIMNHKIRKEK